jgi:hypothetical protein
MDSEHNRPNPHNFMPECTVIILGGEVPEWTNGAVSKTVVVLWATEGSNPSLSASPAADFAKQGNAKSETNHC